MLAPGFEPSNVQKAEKRPRHSRATKKLSQFRNLVMLASGFEPSNVQKAEKQLRHSGETKKLYCHNAQQQRNIVMSTLPLLLQVIGK